MLFQIIKKAAAIWEFYWLVLDKFICVRTIRTGCHKNSLVGSFVVHRAEQVTDSRNSDCMAVPFCLDHDFATNHGPNVKCYNVNTSIRPPSKILPVSSFHAKPAVQLACTAARHHLPIVSRALRTAVQFRQSLPPFRRNGPEAPWCGVQRSMTRDTGDKYDPGEEP
jgi:hypothetical protein